MTSGDEAKSNVGSVTSTRWLVAGGALSVVSALALAWSGTVCVDVLQILLARNLAELTALGQQLGRVSWCPLGLAVAQVLLVIGGFVLHADQSKSIGEPRSWPKSGNMTLSLLWVFGAVATSAWSRRSWELLQLRLNEPVKASLIAEMLNGVLSMSWFASLFLLGHAALTTVVVVVTYRTLSRSRVTCLPGDKTSP